MYELNLQHKFSAAHKLENYIGDCSQIHGHTFRVNIKIKTEELFNSMVIDFKEIKKAIDNKFDHKLINEMVNYNPTAENIARDIHKIIRKLYYSFAEKNQDKSIAEIVIAVWESDNASITYSEDKFK